MQDACGNTLPRGRCGTFPTHLRRRHGLYLYVTDCAGNTHVWTYTYTIDIPDFTLPGRWWRQRSTVQRMHTSNTTSDAGCVRQHDYPVAGVAPSPLTCEGDMVYTFTYTDCAATRMSGPITYTIDIPDFTLPADGSPTVNCAADAIAPTPPVMQDACGNTITPWLVCIPPLLPCEGTWFIPLRLP
jgi:hypothetical protein